MVWAGRGCMRSPFRREIRDWHGGVESKLEPHLGKNVVLLTFGSNLLGSSSAGTYALADRSTFTNLRLNRGSSAKKSIV
jgi:hypothetical protein